MGVRTAPEERVESAVGELAGALFAAAQCHGHREAAEMARCAIGVLIGVAQDFDRVAEAREGGNDGAASGA